MRRLVFITVLLTAAASLADAPHDYGALQTFRAEYEASYAGFSADGIMQLSQAGADGEYIYHAETSARGLARLVRPGTSIEESRFIYRDGDVISLAYTLEGGTKSEDNDTNVRFDWDENVAYSSYEGEAQQVELAAEVRDRLSTDVAVMNDLRAGKQPGPYRIAEKNQVREYEFTFQREETVKVPAGTFDAVVYLRQRPGSSRGTLIWFAKDKNYIPVRLDQLKRGKAVVSTVATAITLNAG